MSPQDQTDILAMASEYEEQQSALHSPSFRLLDTDMGRQQERARRLKALNYRQRDKQKRFIFA